MSFRLFSLIAPAVLGTWFVAGTTFSLLRYGPTSGMYLWFCNLALAGVALGIATRSRSILVAFVAGASFTQTVWLLDNVWRVTTGRNLFGLVEFLYHPGLSTGEFVLSSYHYFVLPAGLVALYYLPRRKDYSPWIVVGAGIALFTLSYFPFTADHNVNCARESCFPGINRWDNTWQYTVIFATMTTGFAVLMTRIWNRILDRIERTPRNEKRLWNGYWALTGLGLIFTTWGAVNKAAMPTFRCAAPYEDSRASIRCLYTLEYDEDVFLLQYELHNKTSEPLSCNTKIALFRDFQLMHQDVYVKPGQRVPVAVLLPYPPRDVTARLTAACGERDL